MIGYFQQGEELGQNTKALEQQEKALRLQVDELKQSVQQQKEMVKVTQQDLEINRKNLERQHQKEKQMAQPLIRYAGVDGSLNQGESRQSVKALNRGHSIKRVDMELIDPPGGLELENQFIDNWDSNSQKDINFVHPAKRYTSNSGFVLQLSYVDGLEERSTQLLWFSFNSSGEMTFSPESRIA